MLRLEINFTREISKTKLNWYRNFMSDLKRWKICLRLECKAFQNIADKVHQVRRKMWSVQWVLCCMLFCDFLTDSILFKSAEIQPYTSFHSAISREKIRNQEYKNHFNNNKRRRNLNVNSVFFMVLYIPIAPLVKSWPGHLTHSKKVRKLGLISYHQSKKRDSPTKAANSNWKIKKVKCHSS